MIHLARAFFVRSQPPAPLRAESTPATLPGPGKHKPVRARPLTPWGTPTKPAVPLEPKSLDAEPVAGQRPGRTGPAAERSVSRLVARITSDPADARRTVIVGRFAEVCAALDRLVKEQEALA